MNRWYGALAAPEIASHLSADSVLCLPIGSYEQHGPHLPLHTDTIIAERFTERIIARYGVDHDLWMLPTMPYGLSLEHAWTSGTISLRVGIDASMAARMCLRDKPRSLGPGPVGELILPVLIRLSRSSGWRSPWPMS